MLDYRLKHTVFLVSFALMLVFSPVTFGAEGLWIPSDINKTHILDSLISAGCLLTNDQIYTENNGSVSNAVIHFNFGCTGSLVSGNGLAVTNYHCLLNSIPTLANPDSLLKYGFQAREREHELKLAGIEVAITRKIIDLTDAFAKILDPIVNYSDKKFTSDTLCQSLEKKFAQETGLIARIEASLHLTKFHLYLTESLTDVRLVLLPPEFINFGIEADNWQWPRHSADFAFVRIYKDEKPLVSPDYLTVADTAPSENDFAMLLGYPTQTNIHLTSAGLASLADSVIPIRSKCLQMRVEHYTRASNRRDSLSNLYSGKRFNTQNFATKFDGAIKMLGRYHAIECKLQEETALAEKDSNISETLRLLYAKEDELSSIEKQNTLLLNSVFGSDLFIATMKLRKLAAPSKDFAKTKEVTLRQLNKFHSETDIETEKEIAAEAFEYYISHSQEKWMPIGLRKMDSTQASVYIHSVFTKTILTDAQKTSRNITKFIVGRNNRITNDPLYKLADDIYHSYLFSLRPASERLTVAVDSLYYQYFNQSKQLEVSPKYPDANATLRISYGNIRKTEPQDGEVLDWRSSKRGFEEKYARDSIKYAMPADFRKYVRDELPDELSICFTTTCHTSGGNSGSPVLNGHGEMIGLNFDRIWQATMSDYFYSDDICRNIAVDMQYIMHLLDHYLDANSVAQEIRDAKPLH